ncbi:putative pre-mRNA-splicing factor ATP-dependent RNA helicase DHX16-like protein [Conidiobolus coronatus NRRL 28638]|uniref:RNA helicase n=1 Tax=Conidiobolus coronatus (strain ATCC 28846 / CBS 209.66 / NRRL 28638) TaxID=796925 RepID=A0A137PHI3_CONC2|nr:putative pre-mRNA-splicing factor ATP-dependent RNA helicase DHX16-like protein [Conidiobolus coronatus NRRL 28638]|eukprot:KXN74448.1 putative pre-mRNA-splicing factor ATP-dependent RNA helicase DHX16-like protein [Conidiobolus coronatus NRRL 28638]
MSSKKPRHLRRKREEDFEESWKPELNENPDKKVRNEVESDDEYEREEREMDADVEERDALANRIRDRDLERAKKVIEDRSSKAENEAAIRRALALDPEAKKAALKDIKERSRQEYLRKREQSRVLMLQERVRDEEELFGSDHKTKREIRELEKDKEILRIVNERQKIQNQDVQGYVMPEDYITEKGKIDSKKKEEALYARYKEDEKIVTEQEQWEQNQIHKSQMQARNVAEDDFDYVFDEEQIEFILSESIKNPPPKAPTALEVQQRKEASIQQVRQSLPIYQYREDLINSVKEYQVLIIVGETGSGKTTQLPQYLHEAGLTAGNKKVGCTQPRRVAAMSVAARVAEEMGVKLGNEVGYSIRFEDCTSDKTLIKYMTDGMLLREFLTEPDLDGYSCLIIDEAHERTLHTDIILGLVKDIAKARPDLRLLISSATMDAQKFSDYFDGAPIFQIPGRPYPVEIYYTKAPEANYLAAVITTVFQIHISQDKGDILVFLTGQEEIEQAQEAILHTSRVLGSKIKELIVAPIYSTLPSDMQGKIFEPTPEGARKVVLATNIAETSITIDGIVFVIDPGFSKQKFFNPKTNMESLIITPCSRASANQRSGRAGRVGPGKCFRLYTQWAYQNELDENTIPEIQRSNLGNIVLTLKSLKIDNILKFDFLDSPPIEAMSKALEQLYALGALNNKGQLTKLGRQMAEFPLDPMMSKMIIASDQYGCTEEVVTIAAMLSVQNAIFYRPKDKQFHADKARQNLFHAEGDHLMMLGNETYRTAKQSHTVNIHPNSSLFESRPKWVVYFELVMTSKEFMRQVLEIKNEWLTEVAPHYYQSKDIQDEEKIKMPKQIAHFQKSKV